MNNKEILNVIESNSLTYQQKILTLAALAEEQTNPIIYSESEKEMLETGLICTMHEGNAPYRPRYIIVDFEKFLAEGSDFLGITPANDIWEATNNLLILYKNIPSITSMPVYLGNLDTLLDRFIEDKNEAEKAIKLFLMHIDKTIADSFCHANIGPDYTLAGEIILDVTKEQNLAVPNITFKMSNNSDDKLLCRAVDSALNTAKPSFANHELFTSDFSGDYAIASCYNGLHIGGGSHTLVRLILSKVAEESKDFKDFFDNCLPQTISLMLSIMDRRVKYLVEESNFFNSSFLVKEQLIDFDKFTAMFGLVGLAECVNYLLMKEGLNGEFGDDEMANSLGLKIIKRVNEIVNNHKAKYCKDNKYLLHAQVGISDDVGITPGCRVPIGQEAMLYDHILQSAPFHKYFPSGIGDIYVFDRTYKSTPNAILDIVKGAFKSGLRYFSLHSVDSDMVRISGYLVKKSEIAKVDNNDTVLNGTTVLGKEARDNLNVFNRKVRTSGEQG